jgi:dTDP-4-amino-4,6-dideoxygalactose transaminase
MILMNDFRAEPEALVEAQARAAEAVIRSGWYVLGNAVRQFEGEWAARCGLPHAVGVGNGLDALEIGLRALGIGSGDEVVTTPMTAFATVLGILRAGALPVLADIDPASALLDRASVERCLSPRTRAVLLVHLYGQLPPMAPWVELCRSRGITLLEDCAQAHGATLGGRVAGSFGAWGAYSFYPTKNLGAIGDGGALVTADDKLATVARQLRNYGQTDRYHHAVLGMNSRLDEIQAAMLSARLPWLDRFTERRRVIVERYRAGIANPALTLLAPPAERSAHVHHLFVVLCDERERLAAHLKAAGVESLVHYPTPAHVQPPGLALRRDPAGLAAVESHARRCLSVPCHPQLSDADADAVVAALNSFR